MGWFNGKSYIDVVIIIIMCVKFKNNLVNWKIINKKLFVFGDDWFNEEFWFRLKVY